MKNLKILFIYLLGLMFIGVSCDSEEDLIDERKADNPLSPEPEPQTGSSGNADFTNYIAIGNSLTAGYMDGALYSDGQANAFPAIIGAQLQVQGIGAGEFNQPDINSENGFNSTFSNLSEGVIAGKTVLDTSIPGPVPTFPGELPTPYTGDKSQLNNFGVPGIQLAQLLTPFTGGPAEMNPAYNGLYARFATNPGSSTILGDALATQPTFFSLWIGNNDVLGYAITGGNGSVPLTDAASFQSNYTEVLSQLVGSGAQGVAINIPPVLLIPFFRAVPYNAIGLSQGEADQLNAGLSGVNDALDAIVAFAGHDAEDAARRKISYSAGANPILAIDEELEDLGPKFDAITGVPGGLTTEQRAALVPYEQSRPLVDGELVLLSAGAVLGTEADGDETDETPTTIGAVIPLGFNIANGALTGDQYYLTLAEQTEIVTARATFNGIIDGVVAEINAGAGADVIAVHDVQPLFADLAGLTPTLAAQLALSQAAQASADGELGVTIDGFNYAPDFSPNGVFSTDGVHPNPKGHAIFANQLIGTINANFGSDIPTIDIVPFRTVLTAQ